MKTARAVVAFRYHDLTDLYVIETKIERKHHTF